MTDSQPSDALVREIHNLIHGPARPILEQACRDWLDGRRRAIAERTDRLPKLPWPLDGRDVDFAGYCAALAIYHDSQCPRCEQRPLFPMPAASGDLSSEEAKQVTYDGVAWVLLRDAITANPDADMLRDAFNVVRAELRRRGVLRDPVAGLEGAPVKAKRSTEKGEGQVKLVAALTKHHTYADGGCLNLEPIGNNQLARLAGVSESTASGFFNKQFEGHAKYRAICADATRLVAALKLLNQEFSPHHLFGAKPPGEDEREDDE